MQQMLGNLLGLLKMYRLKRRGVFSTAPDRRVQPDRNFKRYFALMQQISVRFRAIRRILSSRAALLRNDDLDNEVLWLQLRMIIELATFGAVAADEKGYAARRMDARNPKSYTEDGKVNKILPALKSVSPIFYLPIPLEDAVMLDDAGTFHLNNDSTTFADADRLIQIHNRAGEHLHAHNPLSAKKHAENTARVKASRQAFLEDYAFVWSVLKIHMKACLVFDEASGQPLDRENPDLFWFVYFDESMRGPGVTMLKSSPRD
ncbi:hypothetical protein [Paraburkholderia bryophila]|uniref:Uncharacterized protein n=1 Tax=Paraburkholderia bryophila TaxID=420952 RepID=A0A7Z0B601_9BURK|nr:hypothetical protein [Paraburkholderia bryophila]NYH22881.1 hypothetical protein [Paraburkholderia bryophila]